MIVTLLSDYGSADEFVGVLHGVIRSILPGAEIVDIGHAVRRHDVRHGALMLRNALPYMPAGVHVAIVDPQVGTERRAVAVRAADGRVLVGPDNGVLALALARAGGAVEAVDITRSRHRLEPLSATFHGRDLFAPVAARIAAGGELAEAGEPLGVEELVTLALPQPRVEAGAAVAHAIGVDGYGNVSLNLEHADMLAAGFTLGTAVIVAGGGRSLAATVVQTFADVAAGELLLYEDGFGWGALAVNRGSAAEALGLRRDAELRIERR